MARGKKKQTIYRMFLIPLIVLMLVQSLLSLGIFVFTKTGSTLQNYSVSIMTRMVENRKVILQNDMTQRWTSIAKQEESINHQLRQILQEQDASLDTFLESDELKNQLLEAVFPTCTNLAEGNLTTGVFLVLTGSDCSGAGEYTGFFLRDSNPLANAVDYSDLLMERGSKQLSRTYGISMDTYWTTTFRMNPENQEDDFFYKPWQAGMQYPQAEIDDLGYWSMPFVLGGDSRDAHEMITYSVPLRFEEQVYGVIGVEVSVSYLYDYLPADELSSGTGAGYALALDQGDGTYKTLLGKGILYSTVSTEDGVFAVSDTSYDDLALVEDKKLGNQNIYAAAFPLKLYSAHAPYQNTSWVLIGFNGEEELFGMSHQLYLGMILAVLVGLAFGVAALSLVVHQLTKPIQRLVYCIGQGEEGLKRYAPAGIWEVDELHDVVQELTEKQRASEETLMEETELYRMVLETTKDTFFSYDIKDHSIDIINNEHFTGHFDCKPYGNGFIEMRRVYVDDLELVQRTQEQMPDLWDLEFRISRNEGDGYRWVQIHGNVLRDTSGARWKLVGRIRDIQEEKDRELLEMRKVSVDGVTGFCSYAFGMEQLASMRQRHARGTVLYVTMENLRDIQSQDGLTFADMLLDGFADAVRVCMEEECGLTLRYNETDFCIWLEGRTGQEGIRFYEKCVQILGRQFPENLFSLQLYAGIVTMEKDCRPRTLIGKAQQAEMIASKRQDGYTYWCCSEEELPRTNGAVARQGHQLVTPDYNANSNFVSLSLMLFSKGDGLDAQMYLLFRKLGLFYGAEQICLVMVQPDFHSTYMQYWWNDRYHPTDRERAKTYTDREMNRFISWLGEQELFSWSEKRPLKPEAVEFVRGEMAQNGYGIPLYDNGSLMAIFSVHNVSEQLFGHDEEEKNLLEVSRIIQGQLTQKRHDLASKAKSDFLSRMSHEIRTPMNGIIGMTQIALKNGDDQERVKDCLHKIQNSSDYLLGLINDILDMSKIESGKMSLQMSDFDMNGLIETVSELIGPQAKAKDILFIRDMELVHQWFYGDQMRISQVLINLLGNAVKFTPPGGHVTFSIREQKAVRNRGQLLFVVQDTGIGIRKEDQERVFRSFEQSQTTTVSRQKGTGLGLSISSRLIKMMGSTIQLESTPGVGSTFCFTLTLPFGQPYDKTEKEEIPDFSGMRVLVVEDNDLNAEIAQTLLEDIGFMVDLSYDGAQAVKRMEAMPPGTYDLILMDIMMPVMDGLEATKAIRAMNREDCKRIPIVAMSANVFDEDMKKSVECGMNGHLTKPVEIDKLYKLLREVLHR